MGGELRIGPFRVAEPDHPIGRGGAATVWRATHDDEGAVVALKVLQGRHVDRAAVRAAFADEVRALAGLDHPAVLRAYDHGVIDAVTAERALGAVAPGAPWLAMELASGGSLADAPAPTRWADVAPLVFALLDALGHSHARGVLHRDVKPGNVLLRTDDDHRSGPALGDFGLAWIAGAVRAGSASAGTPAFAAPEQRSGGWRALGPWTDVYAIGATVWWLLHGHAPRGSPGQGFAPRFDVPDGVQGWLVRLLAAAPADRPGDASEARRALIDVVGGGGSARWPRARGPSPIGLPLADLRRPALIGRRDERRALEALAATVVSERRPRLAALDGPDGVGRTALMLGFVEQACEAGEAFIVRWSGLAHTLQAEVDRHATWLPDLLVAAARASDPGEPRTAGLLRSVLVALSRSRLVIVAVDAPREAAPLGAVVAGLADERDAPILTVCADEPGPPFPAPDARIAVPPLSDDAVARVLHEILPLAPGTALGLAVPAAGRVADARRAMIRAARTGALVRVAGAWTAARSVHAAVDAWDATTLADVLAAVPHPGAAEALGVIAAVGGWDDPTVGLIDQGPPFTDLVDALLARGVAVRRGDGVAVDSGLRRAVAARIEAAGLRAQVHGRCADALARAADADPVTLATHLHLAGRQVEAAEVLVRAVTDADRDARYDRVVAATDALAELGPLPRRIALVRLQALNHCGSLGMCEADGRVVLAEALADGDTAVAAQAARSVAVACLRADRVDDALAATRQALALAPGAGSPVLEASCLLLLVDVLLPDGVAEARDAATRALALAEAHGGSPTLLCDAHETLASVARRVGDRDAEQRALEAALAVPGVAPADLAAAQVALGDLHRHAGRREAARAVYEEVAAALTPWREGGERFAVAWLDLALLDLECGDPAAADRRLRELADRYGSSPSLAPLIDVLTAAIAAALGDLGECEVRVRRLVRWYADHRMLVQADAPPLLAGCARAARAAGRHALADAAEGLAERILTRLG